MTVFKIGRKKEEKITKNWKIMSLITTLIQMNETTTTKNINQIIKIKREREREREKMHIYIHFFLLLFFLLL